MGAVSGEAVAGFTVDELAHDAVKRGETRARVRRWARRLARRD